MAFEVILKGARVYDTALRLRGEKKDIAISDGKVFRVADVIDPALAVTVEDLDGYCLSPGWIDAHVHGYGGLTLKDPQALGSKVGVTTNVDAGSFGTLTLEDFLACREASAADMCGFIHINPAGIPYTGLYRADYSSMPVGALIKLIGEHRQIIRGIKLSALSSMPVHILKISKIIAEASEVPLYMHMGELGDFPAPMSITQRAIACLQEGDIAAHVYCNDNGRILDHAGKVFQEVRAAKDRGVLFDVAHGIENFSYEVAERAMDQGILPDLISSDQNNLCGDHPSNLPHVMSKFLALGVSLDDVIKMTTWAPREALKMKDVGALFEGSRADITVFRVEDGTFDFGNCDGAVRRGSMRIVPHHVYIDGQRLECDTEGVQKRQNFIWNIPPTDHVKSLQLTDEHRRFLGELFRRVANLGDFDGTSIHRTFQDTARGLEIRLAAALEALYLAVFGTENYGFTPQVGWLIARQGAAKMSEYRGLLRL